MNYIQGFLLPVPTANRDKYRAMAADAARFFIRYGATRVVECWSTDAPDDAADIRRAAGLKADETAVFAWIEWPDKATCDAGMKAMESDPEMKAPDEMPFDMTRMMWGGFEPIVDAGR